MSQLDTLNQNVPQGYLWVWLDGYIKLVNIKAYLKYINTVDYQEGYQWVYDKSLKDVKLWTLEEVRQNPSILELPTETTRPKETTKLPNETVPKTNETNTPTVPTNGTQIGGVTINTNKVIPYIIGFVLLSVLFLAITNKANE